LCSASANSTNAECTALSQAFDWQDCHFKEGYKATYNSTWKASAKESYGDDCNGEEIIAIGLALSSTSRMVDGYSALLKAKCPSKGNPDPADMSTWNKCLQKGGSADYAARIEALTAVITPLETAFKNNVLLELPPVLETASSTCQEAWKTSQTDKDLKTNFFWTGLTDWTQTYTSAIKNKCTALTTEESRSLDNVYYCDSAGSTDVCPTLTKGADYFDCTMTVLTSEFVSYATKGLEQNDVEGCSQTDEDTILASAKAWVAKEVTDDVDEYYGKQRKSVESCTKGVHPCFAAGGPLSPAKLAAREESAKDDVLQAASSGMYTAFAAIFIATISTLM